jgi:hypothetical protein
MDVGQWRNLVADILLPAADGISPVLYRFFFILEKYGQHTGG